MPKRVMSGGAHFRGLAPGQHNFEELAQLWGVVDNTGSDLTSPGIEPQTFHPAKDVFNHHVWEIRSLNYLPAALQQEHTGEQEG